MFAFLEKRQFLKNISLDRICRLADIGERSLSFEIRSTYKVGVTSRDYSGPAKVFRVQFFYIDPRVLTGNPLTYVGEIYEIDNVHNSSKIEEDVARRIEFIKANPRPQRTP